MQFVLENLAGLHRRLTISLPTQDILREIDQRLKQIAKDTNIPGFRAGKAPFNFIKQRFFDQERRDVIQKLFDKTLQQILNENNLYPADIPTLEKIIGAELKDTEVKCSFTMEVFPEINLSALDTIEIEKINLIFDEPDIDKMVDIIHRQHTIWNTVTDRAAQLGDQIKIDLTGKLENGADNFFGSSGTDINLVLGKNTFPPEFEQQLIGKFSDATQTIELTFPLNYPESELAGQKATYQVTIKTIESPFLPPLDSEFIQQFGIADGSFESFREQIRANTERSIKNNLWTITKRKILQELYQRYPLEVPQCLLEDEKIKLRKAISEDNAALNEDELYAEVHRRIALGMIINEIAKKNNIKLGIRRLQEYVRNISEDYENPDFFKKSCFSDADTLNEIQMIVFENMVVEWVLTQIKVTEKNINFSDYWELFGQNSIQDLEI